MHRSSFGPPHEAPLRRTLGIRDVSSLTSDVGGDYRIIDNRPLHHDRLHRGHIAFAQLVPGLSVHTVDVTDLADVTAEVGMPPSLSFSFILNGEITMTVGGDRVTVGPDVAQAQPQGAFCVLRQQERFTRSARQGCHLRAAVVVVSPDWLAQHDDAGLDASPTFAALAKPIAYGTWTLTPRQIALAEQILRPPQFEPLLHTLMLSSRATEAVAEALRSITGAKPNQTYSLRRRDRDRLEALKRFIESEEAVGYTLDRMAARFGVNAKNLQREFRLAFGTTIYSYLKELRLNKARDALQYSGVTVTQAAYLAGYTAAGNFSTAFRKRFGYSPRQVRAS